MNKYEYRAKRKETAEKTARKIRAAYKKYYKPALRPGIVLAKVCKECNVSRVTYYQAIKELSVSYYQATKDGLI